jgi:nucleotide sugar dehydrogenase
LTRRICVIGSGYVGTVVAASLSLVGHRVTAVEVDRDKLETLRSGRAPFFEPGLDAVIAEQSANGNLTFTGDLETGVRDSEIMFLCVGTPEAPDGRPDMAALESVADAIGRVVDGDRILVTKSTVPVGSNAWVRTRVEEQVAARGLDVSIGIVANPEFLRVGSALRDYLHPDRIVLGSDDQAHLAALVDVYQPIIDQEFPLGDPTGIDPKKPGLITTSLATAETIKYAANSFLAAKISFINEIAQISDRVGADIEVVAKALGMDDRISPRFLRAGLGWGGSCFGKDLSALTSTALEYGYEPSLLRAVSTANEYQRGEVIRKLQRHLGSLRGKRIALLGLAFKPDTDDTRDAPAIHIARRLVELGASVVAHDPVVKSLAQLPAVKVADEAATAADRADAIVVVTEWQQYRELDFVALAANMAGRLVIDGRNCLDPQAVVDAGLAYEGIGRAGYTPSAV